jgi:hypothetical protein
MVDVNPVTNPAIKAMGFTKTMTPGEIASNKVALANLQGRGGDAGRSLQHSRHRREAGGAGGAQPAPAG